MKYELAARAAGIIKTKILTPVIYMSDHGDWVEFICFCDGKITMQELYETEREIKELLEIDVEIVDIREFSEAERIEIIESYELVHSENPLIEKIFTASMLTDYQNLINEKRDMLERQRESGSYYMQ